MITMSKKYRTRDGREVRLLCVDGPQNSFPVCGYIIGDIFFRTWTVRGSNQGFEGPYDLIEVVPDVVRYCAIEIDGSVSSSFPSVSALRTGYTLRGSVAILRATIRNGGKSHTDVTVDVLPVDYQESAP